MFCSEEFVEGWSELFEGKFDNFLVVLQHQKHHHWYIWKFRNLGRKVLVVFQKFSALVVLDGSVMLED